MHSYLYVSCRGWGKGGGGGGKEKFELFLNTTGITLTVKCSLCFLAQVTGIPTVLGIKNGKVVDSFTGLIEKEKLRQFVENLLNGTSNTDQ